MEREKLAIGEVDRGFQRGHDLLLPVADLRTVMPTQVIHVAGGELAITKVEGWRARLCASVGIEKSSMHFNSAPFGIDHREWPFGL
jgi:hypothetical protein